MDELRKAAQDDNAFLAEVAKWLTANARNLNLKGSYNDVYDAADNLVKAVGEEPGETWAWAE